MKQISAILLSCMVLFAVVKVVPGQMGQDEVAASIERLGGVVRHDHDLHLNPVGGQDRLCFLSR